MDTFLPSKPSSYKELLKASIALYRASFTKTVLLALLLSLVVFVPRLISDMIGQEVFSAIPPLSPYRLWVLIIDLASLMFFIAIVWHMYCTVRNVHEPFIQDLQIGIKKTLYVFVTSIIQSAILLAFSLLLYGLLFLLKAYPEFFMHSALGVICLMVLLLGQFVFLLYISTLFIFIIPLIAIENDGVFRAIEHSFLLVWNHWWRVFSLQITPWLYYVLAIFLLRFILRIDIHIYLFDSGSHTLLSTIINLVLFALYIPWVAALLLLQLKDLEFRKKLVTT